MKLRHNYIIPLLFLALLGGCNESDTPQGPDGTAAVPISLSGSMPARVEVSKASPFPSKGSIGVIAANPNQTPVNWTSYTDIANVPVTGTLNGDGTTYSYAWSQQKYWPMDNSPLIFMAYSPYTDNGIGSNINLSALNTTLAISLVDPMQDVLYASNNSAPTSYHKTMKQDVDLGQFKHAMSQLTVNVIWNGTTPTNIVLTDLAVSTTASTASLDLTQGDDGLITNMEDEKFIYSIIDNTQTDITTRFTRTVLLFPDTEEVTEISIGLVDKTTLANSFTGTFTMAMFQNDDLSGKAITLNRGQNTMLTFTISTVPISNTAIAFQGQLTDWISGGNFGIVIK